MDILFDNPLANLYGPYFLVLYAIVIVATLIVLAIAKRVADRSDRLPVPAIPQALDPYETAYLRGGSNEMIRAVLFGLRQKGLIEFATSGSTSSIRRTSVPVPGLDHPLEQNVLGWIGYGRETKECFSDATLKGIVRPVRDTYRIKLERQQMLASGAYSATVAPLKWLAAIGIFGLGAYKIAAAILHGHFNVVFLIILGIAGIVGTFIVGKGIRVTKLGKAYLDRLQVAFGGLKDDSRRLFFTHPATAQSGFANLDPLLLGVGVFGTGILAGTMFSDYNEAFKRAASTSSCGSSCGSCSSSDGGSSCGSSGCSSGCGGGCGGCGS